jgi:hypothetical protein
VDACRVHQAGLLGALAVLAWFLWHWNVIGYRTGGWALLFWWMA